MKRFLSLFRPVVPVVALLWLQSGTVLPAQEQPAPEKAKETEEAKRPASYIRFAEDKDTARLELAVRSFKNKDGKQVDLVSVVHIADRAYYQDLNKRLAEYDAVLYELVGDPTALKPPGETEIKEAAPLPQAEKKETEETTAAEEKEEEPELQFRVLHFIYNALGNFLKLSFQLSEVDYSSPKFIHADMTAEEFSEAQAERGESMISLMLRSMEMQMKGQFSEERRQVEDINFATLIYILASPRGAEEFKIILARMMTASESMMAKAEAESGSVILTARNDVALKKLDEVLKKPDAPKKTAVFYGAAHMPDIERKLIENMGFKPDGEYWLPAWTVEKRAEGK